MRYRVIFQATGSDSDFVEAYHNDLHPACIILTTIIPLISHPLPPLTIEMPVETSL